MHHFSWFFTVPHPSSFLNIHWSSFSTVPHPSLFFIFPCTPSFSVSHPSFIFVLHSSSSFSVSHPSHIPHFKQFLSLFLVSSSSFTFPTSFSASHPLLNLFLHSSSSFTVWFVLFNPFCTYRKKNSRSSASWRFSLFGTALGIQLSFGTVVLSFQSRYFSSLT